MASEAKTKVTKWLIVLAAATIPLLLGQQVEATATQALGAKGDQFNVTGLRESEIGEAGPFRWGNEQVSIALQPLGWPLYTTFSVQGARPEGERLALVGAVSEGKGLGVQEIPRSPTTLEYRLPFATIFDINPRIELTSTTFQPPGDARTLGIAYYSLEQRSGPFPSIPSLSPAIALVLSTILVFLAVTQCLATFSRTPNNDYASAIRHPQSSVPIVAALAWGISIGLLNATFRPWLVFYSLYFIVPPLVSILLSPWAATLRNRGLREVRNQKSEIRSQAVEITVAWRIAAAVTATALVVLAWHFLAPPEPPGHDPTYNLTWGVSFYTALPLYMQLIGAAIVLGTLAWAYFAPVPGSPQPEQDEFTIERSQGFRSNLRYVASSKQYAIPLIGMLIFAVFPVAYSEGDSDEFDTKIPKGAIWRERELLDFYLKVRLWRLLEFIFRLPSHVYALVAVIAGGIYLAGANLVGRTLGRTQTDALVILGALAATGNILIFFRYVESYALVNALSLFVLWACWRYTEGKLSFGAVGALATLAPLVHGSALWWGPMVVAAWLLRARQLPSETRWKQALSDLREGVLVGLAIVTVVAAIMLIDGYDWERLQAGLEEMGGGDARTLLPSFTIETRFEHYAFFSWAHWGAVLQEQLLTAPMAIITLVIVAAFGWRGVKEIVRRTPAVATLGVGAAGMFFYSIAWNPDLGPSNDWDLLALPALPLTLLAVYFLLQLPHGKARRLALAAYLSISGVHAAAWVLLHLLDIRY